MFLATLGLLPCFGFECLGGLYLLFSLGRLGNFYLLRHFPPQMKLLIFFCRMSSMCFSIPWMVVRYCDTPPPNIWTISLHPKIVGLLLSHLSKYSSILSRFFDQIALLSILFPIQPPRIWISSFSWAMWIFASIWVTDGGLLQLFITLCQKVGVPISRITVFLILNFVPDTMHQLCRISNRLPILSFCLRYTVVSSVNNVTMRCSSLPGIWKPWRVLVWCSMFPSGSIARLNSKQDSGSP